MNHKKLLDFFNTYYSPDNMIIVLAGHFNDEDLTKGMDNTFGSMEKGFVPSTSLIDTSSIQPFFTISSKSWPMVSNTFGNESILVSPLITNSPVS